MINRTEIRRMYDKQEIIFPIIGSVIEGNSEGTILCDDEQNPKHVFVINKFGFCQELYTEWNSDFFESIIREKISSRSRMKLRLYNPKGHLQEYVKGLEFAQEAKRTHFVIGEKELVDCENGASNKFHICPMTETNYVDAFGLDLDSRYYSGKEEFCEKAIPYMALVNDEIVGLIYGAGFDGKRYEIDYCVDEKYRNQGIGSALVCAFSKKCFREGKKPDADIYSNNISSIKAIRKCGFKVANEYLFYNINEIK